jgi:hypothetical protein
MSTHRKKPSPSNRVPRGSADRDVLRRSAVENIIVVLEELLPGGAVHGEEYVVRNPTRVDKRPGSFKVRVAGPKAGVWSDFAKTGDKGGVPGCVVAYCR